MRTVDGAGLIDLGEDRWEPVPDRYRRPGRRVPPVLAAVLAAVALVVPGGPERAAPRLIALAEVPATRSAVTALSPDTAFVADWADAVVDGQHLLGLVSAYPLPGGVPRWQARLPVPAQDLRVAAAAGVVLATTVVNGVQAVTALDAGTGRVLWRADSREAVHVPADSGAALFYGPDGSVGWVDLRSGRDVWSRSVPRYGDFGLLPGAGPADRARLMMLSLDGAVDVVDEASGALVASGRIPAPDSGTGTDGDSNGGAGATGGDGGTAAGGDATSGTTVAGVLGRILVMRRQAPDSGSVTAFDPDTFRPLWTVAGTFQGVASACGYLVCLPDAGGLHALDPGSGATAWRSDEWDAARALDAGRLLAFADDPARGLAVLGAGTGRELVRLRGWTSVDDPASHLPVLLARPDDTGGTVIAGLDPGSARPAVLGDLPDAAPSTCQAAGGVLVCATVRHTLRMWRYGR
jgi:outer membrane protein assembly factor BamB